MLTIHRKNLVCALRVKPLLKVDSVPRQPTGLTVPLLVGPHCALKEESHIPWAWSYRALIHKEVKRKNHKPFLERYNDFDQFRLMRINMRVVLCD